MTLRFPMCLPVLFLSSAFGFASGPQSDSEKAREQFLRTMTMEVLSVEQSQNEGVVLAAPGTTLPQIEGRDLRYSTDASRVAAEAFLLDRALDVRSSVGHPRMMALSATWHSILRAAMPPG